MFVGVDGFKKGWVVVAITRSGFGEARMFAKLDKLIECYSGAKVIAVDMPIALVEEGDREADRAARDFLKGQSSSVFNAPPRPVLARPRLSPSPCTTAAVNASRRAPCLTPPSERTCPFTSPRSTSVSLA